MNKNPTTTEAAILAILLSEGPSYGREIVELAGRRTDSKVRLALGTVHPILRALEHEGLLRSWDGESTPERGGRPRRMYELTAEGLRAARVQRKTAGLMFGLTPEGAA